MVSPTQALPTQPPPPRDINLLWIENVRLYCTTESHVLMRIGTLTLSMSSSRFPAEPKNVGYAPKALSMLRAPRGGKKKREKRRREKSYQSDV